MNFWKGSDCPEGEKRVALELSERQMPILFQRIYAYLDHVCTLPLGDVFALSRKEAFCFDNQRVQEDCEAQDFYQVLMRISGIFSYPVMQRMAHVGEGLEKYLGNGRCLRETGEPTHKFSASRLRAWRAYLAERVEQNVGTSLCVLSSPRSRANRLCWDLVHIIEAPNCVMDALVYLLPKIEQVVQIRVERRPSRWDNQASTEDLEAALGAFLAYTPYVKRFEVRCEGFKLSSPYDKAYQSSAWAGFEGAERAHFPDVLSSSLREKREGTIAFHAVQDVCAKLVFAEGQLLVLEDEVDVFLMRDMGLQAALRAALVEGYPDLAKALYQRFNHDFLMLEHDILQLSYALTPRQALLNLRNGLFWGSAGRKGQEMRASNEAQRALDAFFHYIEAMETAVATWLWSLSTPNGESLKCILERVHICTDMTQQKLTVLLEHHASPSDLDKIPQCTTTCLQEAVLEKYRARKKGKETDHASVQGVWFLQKSPDPLLCPFPDKVLREVVRCYRIDTAQDLFDTLAKVPEDYLALVVEELNVSYSYDWVLAVDGLAERIKLLVVGYLLRSAQPLCFQERLQLFWHLSEQEKAAFDQEVRSYPDVFGHHRLWCAVYRIGDVALVGAMLKNCSQREQLMWLSTFHEKTSSFVQILTGLWDCNQVFADTWICQPYKEWLCGMLLGEDIALMPQNNLYVLLWAFSAPSHVAIAPYLTCWHEEKLEAVLLASDGEYGTLFLRVLTLFSHNRTRIRALMHYLGDVCVFHVLLGTFWFAKVHKIQKKVFEVLSACFTDVVEEKGAGWFWQRCDGREIAFLSALQKEDLEWLFAHSLDEDVVRFFEKSGLMHHTWWHTLIPFGQWYRMLTQWVNKGVLRAEDPLVRWLEFGMQNGFKEKDALVVHALVDFIPKSERFWVLAKHITAHKEALIHRLVHHSLQEENALNIALLLLRYLDADRAYKIAFLPDSEGYTLFQPNYAVLTSEQEIRRLLYLLRYAQIYGLQWFRSLLCVKGKGPSVLCYTLLYARLPTCEVMLGYLKDMQQLHVETIQNNYNEKELLSYFASNLHEVENGRRKLSLLLRMLRSEHTFGYETPGRRYLHDPVLGWLQTTQGQEGGPLHAYLDQQQEEAFKAFFLYVCSFAYTSIFRKCLLQENADGETVWARFVQEKSLFLDCVGSVWGCVRGVMMLSSMPRVMGKTFWHQVAAYSCFDTKIIEGFMRNKNTLLAHKRCKMVFWLRQKDREGNTPIHLAFESPWGYKFVAALLQCVPEEELPRLLRLQNNALQMPFDRVQTGGMMHDVLRAVPGAFSVFQEQRHRPVARHMP